MRSELANKLKTLLDNMTQEEFDKEWSKVVEQNKCVKTDFKLLMFPMLVNLGTIDEPKSNTSILILKDYISQMISSNAEYDKRPLKKILNRINQMENKIYIHKETKVLRSEKDYQYMTDKEKQEFEIYK